VHARLAHRPDVVPDTLRRSEHRPRRALRHQLRRAQRAKQLIDAGADVNQWDIFGETPLYLALNSRTRLDGGRASIDPINKTTGTQIVHMLLDKGANPNAQLFFQPANLSGTTNTRGATPLIRAANNNDMEMVKLLLAKGADATL
jgi:ankyrin repeat protein